MAVTEDTHCRFIKLGGYTTRTWVFWGEERLVPVTFAFEVEYRDATHSRGTRMSRSAFDRLHALQGHTPVYVLNVGHRHWWWFQNVFYSTNEAFADPQAFKERLLDKTRRDEPPPPPAGRPSRPATGPYAILGIDRHATFEEVRQAYRLRLSEYHPDKVASLGIELQRVAAEMTHKINHAYGELKALHGK